ncbi:DUF3922 domain-containing protein [Bacillus wiedmannii]
MLTVHTRGRMGMLVQTIFGMDKSKKLGDYVSALQALCEQYNVETERIAIIEATEEYYLFLVKQEDRYDVIKVETVDTNIDYYTKAHKISSFNHSAYQM